MSPNPVALKEMEARSPGWKIAAWEIESRQSTQTV
jgi:hypothetical protein